MEMEMEMEMAPRSTTSSRLRHDGHHAPSAIHHCTGKLKAFTLHEGVQRRSYTRLLIGT
jgi:hypothetical protein